MRQSPKLVALAVFFSFPAGVSHAWADPGPDSRPAALVLPAPANAAPIRASLEALRHTSLVAKPTRVERAATQTSAQPGGHRMSNAAKAAIWIGAVTVAGV